jgi:urease beta subunit
VYVRSLCGTGDSEQQNGIVVNAVRMGSAVHVIDLGDDGSQVGADFHNWAQEEVRQVNGMRAEVTEDARAGARGSVRQLKRGTWLFTKEALKLCA